MRAELAFVNMMMDLRIL